MHLWPAAGPWQLFEAPAASAGCWDWAALRAGVGRLNGDHRPLHMGRYPMEKIKRVDEPTTLIIEDEVPPGAGEGRRLPAGGQRRHGPQVPLAT